MSITTTSLGPNSATVSVSLSGETVVSTANALRDAIASFGWEILFSDPQGGGVLRSRCADGVTFKYLQLKVSGSYVTFNVGEGWTGSALENASYAWNTTNALCALPYHAGGTYFVFATARYALVTLRRTNDVWGTDAGNGFLGCVEVAKDNPEEVAGEYPLFALTNGAHFLGASGNSLGNGDKLPYCLSFPRQAVTGATGQIANSAQGISCIAGAVRSNSLNLIGVLPTGANKLSSSGYPHVFTPYALDYNQGLIRGRIYGVKILPVALGNSMDTIRMRVDANGFYDPAGSTTVKHYILTTALNGRLAIPE